ncbi:MAG TPA: sigma-54 dependent transcriptional regulator [Planctomycetota bacterium]|nr:sigma-54 dependent transcriptional regulator [Planctomycetota bacterium]
MARILLADDERDFRVSVAEALRAAGHDVMQAGTAGEALAILSKEAFDVLLTDLRMPGRSGLELLREAAEKLPEAILIVLTAYGSMESAIEALRIGAHDYMLKPLRLEGLRLKIDRLLEHRDTAAENRMLRGAMESAAFPSGLVGSSPALSEVRRLIAKVAPTDSTVLILGETGTGKELVARAIHRQSPRKDRPFVAVNCGAIPDTLLESELFGHVRGAFTGADRDKRGLFEVAGAGTIFLDEIGELPLSLQPKILRVLESREILRVGSTTPVKVAGRIVAATHRDLKQRSEQQAFRADLYYRLCVFEIPVPPLRSRPEDIGPIASTLLERFSKSMIRPLPSLEEGVLATLQQYHWPGNVRELANVLERAMILSEGPTLGANDLPEFLGSSVKPGEDDLKTARVAFERAHIRRVIEKCGGDKRQAAELLGIDLSSLYRKLEDPPRPTSL